MRTKIYAACAAIISILAGGGTAAYAYVYSSNANYASWSSGSYTIYNNIWGGDCDQWLQINSTSNWGVQSYAWNSGVASYPNIAFWPYVSIANSGNVWVYVNTSTGGGVYDDAYDCWDNNGNEIMIWENWGGGAGPAGSYVGNVTAWGQNFNVYQGWVGHNCVSFLRTSQQWSGTELPNAVCATAQSHGWINGSSLNEVQFGWEITNTQGSWRTYWVNNYSASW